MSVRGSPVTQHSSIRQQLTCAQFHVSNPHVGNKESVEDWRSMFDAG